MILIVVSRLTCDDSTPSTVGIVGAVKTKNDCARRVGQRKTAHIHTVTHYRYRYVNYTQSSLWLVGLVHCWERRGQRDCC